MWWMGNEIAGKKRGGRKRTGEKASRALALTAADVNAHRSIIFSVVGDNFWLCAKRTHSKLRLAFPESIAPGFAHETPQWKHQHAPASRSIIKRASIQFGVKHRMLPRHTKHRKPACRTR